MPYNAVFATEQLDSFRLGQNKNTEVHEWLRCEMILGFCDGYYGIITTLGTRSPSVGF